MPPKTKKAVKKEKKERFKFFTSYLKQIVSEIVPKNENGKSAVSVSGDFIETLDQNLWSTCHRLASAAAEFAASEKKTTVLDRHIYSAVNVFFTDSNLKDEILDYADKALKSYINTVENEELEREVKRSAGIDPKMDKAKPVQVKIKSGLVISTSRSHQVIKDYLGSTNHSVKKISKRTDIALTAVIEYIAFQTIRLADNYADKNGRNRIREEDLSVAVNSSSELTDAMRCLSLTGNL